MSDLSNAVASIEARLADLGSALADVKANLPADVVAPVEAAVEAAPATVETAVQDAATGTPDASLTADIASAHARIDGIATALVTAVQSLDAKIDAGLDVANGWALHPKVAAAGLGGLVTTIAAYVAQLNTVHIAGGNTTAAGATALVAVISGWLKKA